MNCVILTMFITLKELTCPSRIHYGTNVVWALFPLYDRFPMTVRLIGIVAVFGQLAATRRGHSIGRCARVAVGVVLQCSQPIGSRRRRCVVVVSAEPPHLNVKRDIRVKKR